jgi:hypothetical protein
MLHQFFSAETIQVPEECVLLIFLGVFFLGHHCKLPDAWEYVNPNSQFLALATLVIRDKQC